MRALILPALFILAGCGEPRLRVLTPPAELAHCVAEPTAPALPAFDWSSIPAAQAVQKVRDDLIFAYVQTLRSWGGDCEAKVRGLDDWIDVAGKSAR